MPKPSLNRKQSIAKSKQAGQNKKQAVKVFRKEVKTANGGKSRFGRFIKTATSVASQLVPGIGGQLAGALNGIASKPKGGKEAQEYVKQLPAFEQSAGDIAQALGNGAMQAAANAGANIKPTPVVLMSTPPPIVEQPQESTKEQSIGTTGTKQSAGAQSANSGGGGGGGFNEDMDGEPQQTRTSFAPTTGGKEITPEPKKNKTLFLIIGAAVVSVIVLIVIVKMVTKK